LRLVAALQKVLGADVTLCLDLGSSHRPASLQLHGTADPHQQRPADFGCRLAEGHRGVAHSAILLAGLPSGFFGILFGLRANVTHSAVGTSVVVSTALSAATLPVAIYLTAGMSAA
jgi:hypothetical protein